MSLNDTASITLLTGLPGAGKTLRLIQFIVTAVEAGELVYVCNVNKINVPGVIPWADPSAWEDLPPGATLVIDETQDYFPRRRTGDPTPAVRQLSKIRHSGVRLLMATQDPSYLDQHLLGLVGMHEHLLRMNGKDETFIFRHNTVMENIRKPFKVIKNQYDHERWSLPQRFFQYYQSAEIHTIKYRMPALMKKALVFGPLSLALAFGTWFFIFRDGYAQAHRGQQASEAEPGPAGPVTTSEPATSSGTRAGKPMITSAEEYATMLTPLVPGRPWTAPAYINQPVRSEPHVYCVSSQAGETLEGWKPASVTCLTEQGSRVEMDAQLARDYAANGEPYNPFKAPIREARESGRRQDKPEPSKPARELVPVPSIGVGQPDDFQSRYGGMRGAIGEPPVSVGI